jgi:hypothetical protein
LRVLLLAGSDLGAYDRWLACGVVRSPTPAPAVRVTSVESVVGFVAISAGLLSGLGCSSGAPEISMGGDGSHGLDAGATADSTASDSTDDLTAEGIVEAPIESDGSVLDSTLDGVADAWTATDSSGDAAGGEASDGATVNDVPEGASMDAPDGAWSSDAPEDGSNSDALDGGSEASAACTVFDASSLDDAAVYAGFQQVLATYHCYRCHQDPSIHPVDEAGRGIVLSGNNAGLDHDAYPPNLTNDPTGLGCWTNQQIENAILNGLDNMDAALCPPMPLWGQAGSRPGTPMDAGTAQEIIAFLRSLPPVANLVPPTNCSAADAGDR